MICRPLLFFFATLIGCVAASIAFCHAAIREPVWAGRFYPDSREELEGMIKQLTAAAKTDPGIDFQHDRLRALIIPHAGYIYSGATAAHAALAIGKDRFSRVVLLGPDHRVGFRNASLTQASHWRTPLGTIPITDCSRLLETRPELFASISASDRQEHSLEVTLPFIQSRLSRFELIPIVLGPCHSGRMAEAIWPIIRQPKTLVVVSADLSHYLPYDRAVKRDRETLERIKSLDPDWDKDQDNRSCGRYPIGVLLNLAHKHHWRPVVLHYSNSGDTAGDKSSVVGYGAVGFYGDEPMQTQGDGQQSLTPRQGAALVALARQTLSDHFGEASDAADAQSLKALLADPALQAHCGTFVTLTIDNQLRGCIGSLSASTPIVTNVRDNALNAALHDPRFAPLSKAELATTHIEVSVLTEPTVLHYVDADDLAAKLRPGVDGVIIKKGYASATFLPQVWEQLPQPEQFLSHLCMKAGLTADQWRHGDLAVQVYQVQYFEEAH